MNTLIENLKILEKDINIGQVDQNRYRETYNLMQQHDVGPNHDKNCELCRIYEKVFKK